MDVGDVILEALLSVLIAAMVYLWFLSLVIPHSESIFNASENLDNVTQQILPP